MAKVSVIYDTVDKTVEAYMDGNPISDLAECSVYHSYETDKEGNPKFALSVTTMKHDKDNDMHKFEYIRATVKQEEKPSTAQMIANMIFPSA